MLLLLLGLTLTLLLPAWLWGPCYMLAGCQVMCTLSVLHEPLLLLLSPRVCEPAECTMRWHWPRETPQSTWWAGSCSHPQPSLIPSRVLWDILLLLLLLLHHELLCKGCLLVLPLLQGGL